jgi:uncharacterized protein (TIGR01777 family)
MKVLVTGASGLIGTALCAALEARGDEVIRLVRPKSVAPGTESIAWDPTKGTLDLAALEAAGPIAGVVHLAGAGIADKRWSSARKTEILRSRTASTELLVTSLRQLSARPAVLVSGSAIGIYGSRGDEILTEASSHGTGFLAEVCEAWEAAAQPASESGIRTVLARTGIVLSRSGGALGRQLPLFRLGLGGRLGQGKQWMSWISLDDEVAGLLRCLDDATLSGPINLVSPSPVTNAGFTKTLGRALHRPTALVVPPVALKVALGAELVDEALLASQRILPSALEHAGFTFGTPELDAALTMLLS